MKDLADGIVDRVRDMLTSQLSLHSLAPPLALRFGSEKMPPPDKQGGVDGRAPPLKSDPEVKLLDANGLGTELLVVLREEVGRLEELWVELRKERTLVAAERRALPKVPSSLRRCSSLG